MKRIIVSASSDMGYVRKNNEDMVLAGSKKVRDGKFAGDYAVADDNKVVLAVADGMGGYDCGEVASELVIDSLYFYVNDLPANLSEMQFRKCMNDWVENECRVLESKGEVDESLATMGTTLVALICYGGCFYSVNCGDSRLYRMRDGVLTQISRDHTPEAAAGWMKRSHSVTNCFGGGCTSTYIDIENITERVLSGDVFVLCSDGLTDMLDDASIAAVLQKGGDSPTADSLVNAALEAGGIDNVSVCVAKYENTRNS